MKFEDFIKNRQIKNTIKDMQLAKSLLSTAEQDLEFFKTLPINNISARKIVSNYYDILRSTLEALASLEGYKVYSHEAFTYYLKEKGEGDTSRKFERLRKIRNSINYYGKEISAEEAKELVNEILALIGKIKSMLLKKMQHA